MTEYYRVQFFRNGVVQSQDFDSYDTAKKFSMGLWQLYAIQSVVLRMLRSSTMDVRD